MMESSSGSDSSDADVSPVSDSELSDHENRRGEEGIQPYQYEPVASDSGDEDDGDDRILREGDAENRLGNNHW